MQIYLIRHGETAWNERGLFQGQKDIPLNDYGRQMAEFTREGLPDISWDKVYSSPLHRAYETAQILLNDKDISIETDDRLKEINFGPYEGSPILDVANNTEHPMYVFLKHPELFRGVADAESIEDVVLRAKDFLQEKVLPLENTCDNMLLTIHGALMRAFLIVTGHKTVADFWKVSYPNCAVTILKLEKGKMFLEREAVVFYNLDEKRIVRWDK